MRALPGSGGDGFTLLGGEGVTGKEVLEGAQSGFNLQRLGCRRSPLRRRPGRSGCIGAVMCCSLCLPSAGLCESAFLQSEQDSGERQEDVRARGAWQGGGWREDLIKKGAACELGVVSCRGSAICSLQVLAH